MDAPAPQIPVAEIAVENTGERFACPANVTILDAGLAAGLHMPHNCRGGACGTCKSQLLEGAVDHGRLMSFAITDAEKAQGLFLACQAQPRAPRIRLRTLEPMPSRVAGEIAIVPMQVNGRVVAAHDVTPSIRRLVVALPRGVPFRYRAGMNMEVLAPGLDQARPYSIANAPGPDATPEDGQLVFYVTRHDHGRCSTWLHGLAVEDVLVLHGPYGEFHLPPVLEGGRVLGLAAGSGLSPMLSVLTKALADGHRGPIDLLFSARDRREIFAADALAGLAHHHPNFAYRVTLTRAPPGDDPCLRGRVPDLLARSGQDLTTTTVLVAGALGFVDACVAAARRAGADPSRIATDAFLSRVPPRPAN
jgi:ferredoxin-NAD(P)+ reductase (naphthalene dioxygenase ferredoxin-specific)